jgi:hypothetical protein
LLRIQENAYSLFCVLYPDKDHNAFVEEWLDYQNREGIFQAESLNSSNLTKIPLRYWRTVLLHAPNLAEFACRLFSIPPNSATSERVWSLMGNIHTERRNRLSPKRTVKMAQITWYMKEKLLAKKPKTTQDSLKIFDELNDNDLTDGDGINVDEIIDDLEQVSERIIDDISILINANNHQSPTLSEIFNLQLIETILNEELNS